MAECHRLAAGSRHTMNPYGTTKAARQMFRDDQHEQRKVDLLAQLITHLANHPFPDVYTQLDALHLLNQLNRRSTTR